MADADSQKNEVTDEVQKQTAPAESPKADKVEAEETKLETTEESKPTSEEAPATEEAAETPAEAPPTEEAPSTEAEPTSEEAPTTEEQPGTEETPASEEAQITEEAPDAEEAPCSEEAQATEETPAAEEASEVTPATEDVADQAAEETVEVEEAPVSEEAAVSAEEVVSEEAPAKEATPPGSRQSSGKSSRHSSAGSSRSKGSKKPSESGSRHSSRQSSRQSSAKGEKSASELSGKETKRYRLVFEKKAVDGRLDLPGFKLLFRLMGEVLSAGDAQAMFDEGDRDDNGTIDFDEFCRLYSKFSHEEQERKEGMLQSIDKLFPGEDGQPVKLKKVEKLLMKLQKPDLDMRLTREKSDLSEKDVKHMVRAMDVDGNGYISKEEFVNRLCQHMDIEG